jgi:hypothetical protein
MLQRGHQQRVSSLATGNDSRGLALISYLRGSVAASDKEAATFSGHSNRWESREIARAVSELGYGVDVVDWNDDGFTPDHEYRLVLAINGQLLRLAEATRASQLLLHITGSYPPFQNAAERRRLNELEERRGIVCAPRRIVEDEAEFVCALEQATACSLLGNSFTLSTFPEQLRAKITLLPVSASRLARIKAPNELVPEQREFLWFFGGGAVHKGLDRVLEVFARNPRLTLNVVGNLSTEEDFFAAFYRELTQLANIKWHGFLDPASSEFASIAARCAAFVAPSCSESISAAAATLLQVGLYPIVSRETGISLPAGAGTYLESSSVDEIEAAATDVIEMPWRELADQIERTQAVALVAYSRQSFAAAVREYLRGAVE